MEWINYILEAFITAICLLGISCFFEWVFNRKHEKYRKKNFKVGDRVNFARDSYTDAEILEINGDEYTIKTKIYKKDLYEK